ncbi:MAG: ABC transporter substrate-binding protein [Chloroflexota bacterium]
MRLRMCLLAVLLGVVILRPAAAQEWLSFSAPDCDYGGNLKAIEAIDALTVRFTFCQPDPAFPYKAAFSAFAITPSEYLQSTGGGGDLIRKPIGTGPYMVDHWDAGQALVLKANPHYWGLPPFDPNLIVRWSPDPADRLAALKAGDVDGIDNPAPEDFAAIAADPSLALYERPSTNVFYLGINNTIAPFDNPKVRQALAYAIDKAGIVHDFYPEGSVAAEQFMPPSIFGYTPEVQDMAYNPDTAKQLLQDSGVTLPIQATLSYANVVRSYLPKPTAIADRIQEELAAVGIDVQLDLEEWTHYLDAAEEGKLSLHLLGWGADYPDATNFLDYHFGAGASSQFGNKLTDITAPLMQAARLGDVAQRYPIYVQANTAIRDLVPMVPIAHATSGTAFRASVRGAHSSPLSSEYFAVMDDVTDDTLIWMQNAEPSGLYCPDESDGESLRMCLQISESLLAYEISGTRVMPSLARDYVSNADATQWVFHLREGVLFQDGSALDANDVVMSYDVQWDAANPLHVGRTGDFTYFSAFFGGFLNAK